MLCRRDYDERVFASFYYQIKSEYYGGNRSVSIEVIELEHLSTLPNSGINSSTKSCPRHAEFHSFFRMISNKMLSNLLLTTHNQDQIILLIFTIPPGSYISLSFPFPFLSESSIFKKFISWRFTFHIYKYWVQITVVTLVDLCLNTANHFKMCYVSMIMLRG